MFYFTLRYLFSDIPRQDSDENVKSQVHDPGGGNKELYEGSLFIRRSEPRTSPTSKSGP